MGRDKMDIVIKGVEAAQAKLVPDIGNLGLNLLD